VATDRARQRSSRGRALGTEAVPEEDWDRVLVEPGGGPDAAASRAEQRERIRRGLDALPEHHRAIIMLSDLEGLSYREIAEVPDGATQRWTVPGERQLEVTPEGVDGNSVRLRVRLERNGRAEVNTSIQAASGNPAVIGGPKHADGVLIIVVWANANPTRRP